MCLSVNTACACFAANADGQASNHERLPSARTGRSREAAFRYHLSNGIYTARALQRGLGETRDLLAAIKAVREVFGLSVAEAKDVWLQATGRAATLTDHQERLAAAVPRIVCPRCRSDATVIRKQHALPKGLAYVDAAAVGDLGPDFVNGFWCSTCQLGFVQDHLLDELGLISFRPI